MENNDDEKIVEYLNELLSKERILFCPLVRSFLKFDLGSANQQLTDSQQELGASQYTLNVRRT